MHSMVNITIWPTPRSDYVFVYGGHIHQKHLWSTKLGLKKYTVFSLWKAVSKTTLDFPKLTMCTDKITGNYDLYFSPLSYHSNNKLTLDHHSLSTHISEYNNKLIKVTICYLSQKAVFTDPVQQMSTNKQERGGHTFWKLYSSFAIKLFMDAALKWTHLMNIIKKLSKSMKHFKYFVHTIQFFFLNIATDPTFTNKFTIK